jgi:hypothetical protein
MNNNKKVIFQVSLCSGSKNCLWINKNSISLLIEHSIVRTINFKKSISRPLILKESNFFVRINFIIEKKKSEAQNWSYNSLINMRVLSTLTADGQQKKIFRIINVTKHNRDDDE